MKLSNIIMFVISIFFVVGCGWQQPLPGEECEEEGCNNVIDTDGDGIPDDRDQCPTRAETWNNYQDTDGCPDEKPSTPTPEPECRRNSDCTTGEVCNHLGWCVNDGKCRNDGECWDNNPRTDDVCNADGTCSNPGNDWCSADSECAAGEKCYGGECVAIPNNDRDGDGITNDRDTCPDSAEDRDGYEDTDGCPEDGPHWVKLSITSPQPAQAHVYYGERVDTGGNLVAYDHYATTPWDGNFDRNQLCKWGWFEVDLRVAHEINPEMPWYNNPGAPTFQGVRIWVNDREITWTTISHQWEGGSNIKVSADQVPGCN